MVINSANMWNWVVNLYIADVVVVAVLSLLIIEMARPFKKSFV